MTNTPAGKLAVRAVNEYRRRDVLSYLALRYYLDNAAARSDHWAKTVAVDLVLSRSVIPYYQTYHFKEITDDRRVEHRSLFIPSANEALAEAALLDECSKSDVFKNPDCVFSYNLNSGDSKTGVFQPYIHGLRKRHDAIAGACQGEAGGVVRYIDIKSFYPSIQMDVARKVWKKYADTIIPTKFMELGEKLLNDQEQIPPTVRNSMGLVVGPMFNHLIANLALRELDTEWCKGMRARYFRYVDDITLIGTKSNVEQSFVLLRDKLGDFGLELHGDSSPKNLTVPLDEWLKGRNDFSQSTREVSWLTFIRDLKTFLLCHPNQRDELRTAFDNEGMRIPVPDYSMAVEERHYLQAIISCAQDLWFRIRNRKISVSSLVRQAQFLRRNYEAEFERLMLTVANAEGYRRKRMIPKLRYRASRLIYLSSDDTLGSLSKEAAPIPELGLHSAVMSAVATKNIDWLQHFGVNAAQSAAQPLKSTRYSVTTESSLWSPIYEQSVAVFYLNGLGVNRQVGSIEKDTELMRFAMSGASSALMQSENAFLREVSCLHGLAQSARHSHMLQTPFDTDEELAMDAVSLIEDSLSP